MHTYEMIGVADQNGKTYESKYGTYSKEKGFKFIDSYKNNEQVSTLINNLVHEDCWSLKIDKKKMTKSDIEKALGYEIEIIGCDNQLNKLDPDNIFENYKIYSDKNDDLV